MSYTLEQFAASCHDILKADPGPVGRRKVCLLLEQAIQDESFVATHLTKNTSERTLLYEDPELGFCILAHVYQGPKDSAPHDHGPWWAIYGQAEGETQMTDWKQVRACARQHVRESPPCANLHIDAGYGSPLQRGRCALAEARGPNTTDPHRGAQHGEGPAVHLSTRVKRPLEKGSNHHGPVRIC